MKNYIAILLATVFVAAFSLTGCKKKADDKTQTEEEVRSKVEAAAMNFVVVKL